MSKQEKKSIKWRTNKSLLEKQPRYTIVATFDHQFLVRKPIERSGSPNEMSAFRKLRSPEWRVKSYYDSYSMHLLHLHHLTSTMTSLVSDFQKKTLRSQRSRFGVAIDHWPKEWAIWVDRPVHSADVWLEHMCSLSRWKSPVIVRRVRSAWNPDSSFEVLDQPVMSSVFVNWSSYPSTLFGSLNRAGHHLPAHSKNCNCTHLANTKTRDVKRKYMKILYKNYVSYTVIQLCLPAHLLPASASTSSASAGSVQRPFLERFWRCKNLWIFSKTSIGSDDSKSWDSWDSLTPWWGPRGPWEFFLPALLPSSSFVVESKSNKFHQYLLFVSICHMMLHTYHDIEITWNHDHQSLPFSQLHLKFAIQIYRILTSTAFSEGMPLFTTSYLT